MIKIVYKLFVGGGEIFVPFVIEWKMPTNLPKFFRCERLFFVDLSIKYVVFVCEFDCRQQQIIFSICLSV